MPLILPRPNPLAYPAGVAPGFDATHIAARNIVNGRGLSMIFLGGGAIDLCSGTPGTVSGTPVKNLNGIIGPGLAFSGTQNITYASKLTTVESNVTFGAIFQYQTSAATQVLIITSSNGSGGFYLGIPATNLPTFGSLAGNAKTSATTLTAGVYYFVVASYDGGSTKGRFTAVRLDTGAKVISEETASGALTNGTWNGTYVVGNGVTTRAVIGSMAAAMWAPVNLSLRQQDQWAADPWSFWYPRRQTNVIAASAINNAVLNITEGDDALAATAALLIQAALAATEADDSLSAAAQVLITTLLSGGETSDTVAAAVTVAIQAIAAISEQDDGLSATCNTLGLGSINAFLSAIEQDDRIFASVHRNSYIPNPTERGHYISRHAPKPWLGGLGEGPTK